MTPAPRSDRDAVHAPACLDHCPLMPTYGAPPVMFVRGQGTELWDADGRGTSTSCPASRSRPSATAHPAVADGAARAGPHAAARVEPLRQPTWPPRWPCTIDGLLGGGGQVFFCNSGAEANEARDQAGPQVGRPRPPRGRQRLRVASTAARWPRSHATGQPTKHEAFQPLPEGFRHVAWNDLDALGGGHRPERQRGPARAGAGRGRREPGARPGTSRACASCATSVGCCSMVDEVQTGFARTGSVVRLSSTSASGPTSSRMAKALGNGVPIGACWARREVAAAFQPGDHATTFGGTPIATAAARAVLAEMQRIDAPALAARRARASTRRPRGHARGGRRARPRAAAGRRARRPRRQGGGHRAAWSGAGRQRGDAHRAAPRAAAHRHRRRDRRGRRPSSQEVAAPSGRRHFLDVDDLERRRAGDRARPGRAAVAARPVLAGQGVALHLREAVEPDPPLDGDGRRAARRPSRLHRGATRSASTSASRSRTSPGSWPATTPCSRPGCSSTPGRRAHGGGVRRSRSSTCCPTAPTRCRPSPTCSPCARPSARWPAARWPTSATTTTWPARSAEASARCSACTSASAARPATTPDDGGAGARRGARRRHRVSRTASRRGGERRRRRPHRRLDVDGPGGRGARSGAAAFAGFTVDRGADGRRRARLRCSSTACRPTAARRWRPR